MEKKVIVLDIPYIESYENYQKETEFLMQEEKNKKKLINIWEEYKDKYSSVPFEIDFEFWYGTNEIYNYKLERIYKCFYEEEIAAIKEKIKNLVVANQIVGLIVSPLLTEQEIEWGTRFQTFANLYDCIHQDVPIYYIDFSVADRRRIGGAYLEDLEPFKKVVEDFRNAGYKEENGFIEGPYMPADFFHYRIGSEEMLRYFLDFHKTQEECLKRERTKEI